MTEVGKYIYCIVGTSEKRNFGPIGIGGRGDEVYTVCYRDLAAVISDSPIIKYSICRENTLAHQVVMEKVMKDCTILPVRFGTIAEGKDGVAPEERIKEKVLKERYEEFKDLLKKMDGKIELGVKALWANMGTIFDEIVEENKGVKRLKQKILAAKLPAQTRADTVAVGEMVKSALEAKKDKKGKEILDALKKFSVDFRTNKVFGDKMVMNAAFLVDKAREKQFDEEINKLEARYDGRIKFKYVGPIPPCNFVEIVVTW
ncbi:MAG: GvpL/GvpF family gas vesicle protein [Actinomycetota bacterium]|nr:GvpL/GvpF family gas vesicle protein [Actinomycetota bacterium]